MVLSGTEFGKRDRSVELEGQPTQRSLSPSSGDNQDNAIQISVASTTVANGNSPDVSESVSSTHERKLRESCTRVQKKEEKQTGRGTKGIETSVTCSCRIGIEGREVEVLIDTGSSVTLARESAVEQASIKETRPPRSCLKSATGHEIQVIHEAKLAYEVGGEQVVHWTYICPNLAHDALIGYDFVTNHDVVIDGKEQTIRCKQSRKLPIRQASFAMQISVTQESKSKENPEENSREHGIGTPGQALEGRERQDSEGDRQVPEEILQGRTSQEGDHRKRRNTEAAEDNRNRFDRPGVRTCVAPLRPTAVTPDLSELFVCARPAGTSATAVIRPLAD